MSKYHLTKASANKKLGHSVAASTSSKDTCPSKCPFKLDGSCYAMKGPQSWHWSKVSSGERGSNWYDFVDKVKTLRKNQLFRVNVSGDLPTDQEELIDEDKLIALINACENRGLRAWTYTHLHLISDKNLETIRQLVSDNLTINLSCEDVGEALDYREHGFNVSIVNDDLFDYLTINHDLFYERKFLGSFIACPEQYKEGVTCSTCRLCTKNNINRPIVVFKKH